MGALAHELNAEPIQGWVFILEDQIIRMFRSLRGGRQQVATWTLDQHMRLQSGEHLTEWVTSESYTRVIDQAVKFTAKIIVEAENGDDRRAQGLWSCRRGFDGPMFRAAKFAVVDRWSFPHNRREAVAGGSAGYSSFKTIIMRQSRRRCLRV